LQDHVDHARSTSGEHRRELLTNALLRAGEIECALADLGRLAAHKAEALTYSLARAIVADTPDISRPLAQLRASDLPDLLTVATPEGFAYYALDPLRYAEVVRDLGERPAFVVGIRSIGTVLSAVCAAALGCERITVRPLGHPYDRELHVRAEDRVRIREQADRDAQFFIVDEGPGLSGSSFLATAEALEREGVRRERITLIGSHDCDGHGLVARNAAARWQRFRFVPVLPSAPPPDSRPFLDWDRRCESSLRANEWPATWAQLTPPKYLSCEGDTFWKFEGVGRAGDQVRARAHTLAVAGFAPRVVAETRGFTGYQYVKAGLCSVWNAQIAQRIAEYVAFRSTEFAACVDPGALGDMVTHNVATLLGAEFQDLTLQVAHACICDNRLMPHEWIRTGDDRILKTDATMHGDDHFYPGPCDIGWDIAGTIIEWSLGPVEEDRFLTGYEGLTRDHVRERLPFYKVAYSAFRAAYARMAASATTGTAEAERFTRDFRRYMNVLRWETKPFLRPKKIYSIA
jgi:hypothetical protein